MASAEAGAREGMTVEVAYARPDTQLILEVIVPEGATVEDALRASGIDARFPEIDLEAAKVGIFGKLTKRDTVLKPRDRVEIYRPLFADPKEVRKQRAAAGKRMKKGGGDIEEPETSN
ncbi:RnfH family protein [Thioalkalivibrio sulfidiphilus]|uniref:RnfH family protein n=1 Tax=Thioalkalivibrio sulfidiphilus TaxID=1033854 RepID=UPI00037C911F|nr:RnfH family protein [Thioalkalivibrio sulfidiphilus]